MQGADWLRQLSDGGLAESVCMSLFLKQYVQCSVLTGSNSSVPEAWLSICMSDCVSVHLKRCIDCSVLTGSGSSVMEAWLWNLLNVGVALVGYHAAALSIDWKWWGRVRMQVCLCCTIKCIPAMSISVAVITVSVAIVPVSGGAGCKCRLAESQDQTSMMAVVTTIIDLHLFC